MFNIFILIILYFLVSVIYIMIRAWLTVLSISSVWKKPNIFDYIFAYPLYFITRRK